MSDTKNGSRRALLLLSVIGISTKICADHDVPLENHPLDAAPSSTESIQYQHCNKDYLEEKPEILCEVKSTDAPAFNTKPILSFAEQVDIRPENCESYFDDYLHTRRGLRIESALEVMPRFRHYTGTVSTFPVIDFYGMGHAHVVKSKDLTAQVYSGNTESDALYKSIMADAADIQERFLDVLAEDQFITDSVRGVTTTIRNGDISNVVLHIVIQTGIATADQINQLKRAKLELDSRWGFNLKVIEIP